jgi:hypothetical protein
VETQALVAFDEDAIEQLVFQKVAHALGAASLGKLLGAHAEVTVGEDGVKVTRSLVRKLGKPASDELLPEIGPDELAELMHGGEPAVLTELADGVIATIKLTSVLAYTGTAWGPQLKSLLDSADAQRLRKAKFTFPQEWAHELSAEYV